jgi:hypothetical protein
MKTSHTHEWQRGDILCVKTVPYRFKPLAEPWKESQPVEIDVWLDTAAA